MLMTADGTFIAAGKSGHFQFMATLLINSGTLKAGKYIVVVDPCNSTGSKDHDDYKKLLIDFYCSQKIKLNKFDGKTGMDCVRKCMKGLALSDEFKNDREAFLAQNSGMEDIFRVNLLNAKNSGFSILYNKNGTGKTLEMTMKVQYTGGDIIDEDGE
jgi:hypothetical protein